MSKFSGYNSQFNKLIEDFKLDYPNMPESKIGEILENRIFNLFKEHIIDMNLPQDISVMDLRKMRGKIRIMERSGRYDKKIDRIYRKYNTNRYFLKLKGIQDSLKIWEQYSNYNNLTIITNGSNIKYSNETRMYLNGNKNMGSSISLKPSNIYQNQSEFIKSHFNMSNNEKLESKFNTGFEFYKDHLTEYEKMGIKQKDKEEKIPIDLDLLERIKSIKAEPMEKKVKRNHSISELKDKIDELLVD